MIMPWRESGFPARLGKVRMKVVPGQGPLASRQGHPGSVPKRKDLPHLRGRRRTPGEIELTWISDGRESRVWHLGIAGS